jgi:hypothetical protein
MSSFQTDKSEWEIVQKRKEFGPKNWPLAARMVRHYDQDFQKSSEIILAILSTSEGLYGPPMLPWAALGVKNYLSLDKFKSAEDLESEVSIRVQKLGSVANWDILLSQDTNSLLDRISEQRDIIKFEKLSLSTGRQFQYMPLSARLVHVPTHSHKD